MVWEGKEAASIIQELPLRTTAGRMFKSRFQLQFAAGLWPAASHFWRIAFFRKENGRFASAQAISPWSFPNGVRKNPGQESCGFLGFFAFPVYSSFCPKSRKRRGQKRCPLLCRKELRKRPFRPLCGLKKTVKPRQVL